MANGWGNIDYKTFSDEMGPWFERQQQPQRARNSDDDEEDGNNPEPPNIGEVMSMYDQYVQSNPLNAQEQDRLGDLQNRAQRLQPMSQEQQYGSGRIRGNPYSVDASGAITGAANLVKGGINRVRRNRREEFSDEYGDLTGREEQAQQAQEGKQQLIGDLLPEQFSQGQQNYRTEIKEQGRSDRLTQEHDLEKEFLDYQTEVEEEQGGQLSPSIVTGMANTARDIAKAREGRAQELKEIKQGDYYTSENWPNIDQDIERLEGEADQLYKVAGSVFTSQGGINPQSVQRMNEIIGGDNQQPDPSGEGDDMVAPNNQGQQMTPERIEEIVRGFMNENSGRSAPSGSAENNNQSGNNTNSYDPHDPNTW